MVTYMEAKLKQCDQETRNVTNLYLLEEAGMVSPWYCPERTSLIDALALAW